MTFESSFANFDENMEGFNPDCRKSRRGLYLQVRGLPIFLLNYDIMIFYSFSETVIFFNLVTTISCQITMPKIGFIGLLIILLILTL